jgi:penicillin-binding protein 1B
VDDSPTAFINGDDVYTPKNYQDKYNGQVTAQYALAHSLNNATVKVAEMVGYDKVANLARETGIASVKATPAMALGSYDATPLEMASAYTVFTNAGQRITPLMVKSVRDPNGDVVDNYQPLKTQVLDPRVSYVITDMLQGVMNTGTAAGVRGRGFTAPAAGKTGSSHDAWFAGFTSNLLCIVWVGYDDYSDIKLSGAALALPVWTEFMKRATNLPEYSDVKPFTPPDGVVELTLDKNTNQIATPACPDDYRTAFIEGTQPTQTCEQTASEHGNFFQRIFGGEPKQPPPVSNTNGPPAQSTGQQYPANPASARTPDDDKNKKKGFWGRIFGSSKDDKKDDNKEKKPATNGPGDRPPQ